MDERRDIRTIDEERLAALLDFALQEGEVPDETTASPTGEAPPPPSEETPDRSSDEEEAS